MHFFMYAKTQPAKKSKCGVHEKRWHSFSICMSTKGD